MPQLKTKQDVLDLIKGDVSQLVAEVIEEKMAKTNEQWDAKHAGLIEEAKRASIEAAGGIIRHASPADVQMERRRKASRFLRCLASAGGNPKEAADFATKLGYGDVAKALGESVGAAGGFLVQPEVGEWISSLSADAVVRQNGAREIPMPSGQITLPAGRGGVTATWVGESTPVNASQPNMGQVNLAAKKMMIVVPLSNELLNDAGGMADQWAEDEAKVGAAATEDLAFLRGTGGANSPTGMLHQAAAANVIAITHAGAVATVDEIFADLGRVIQAVVGNNVPLVRGAWEFSKRIEWHLKTLLNANNIPVFKEEMDKGTLFGFPFKSTTQIPNNLDTSGGGANDESEVYFADHFSTVIGDTGEVAIEVIKGAAYVDSTGTLVSGVSRDETCLVLKKRVDFRSLYQGQDIGVLTEVDWGA